MNFSELFDWIESLEKRIKKLENDKIDLLGSNIDNVKIRATNKVSGCVGIFGKHCNYFPCTREVCNADVLDNGVPIKWS